jgi:hypothetical protein
MLAWLTLQRKPDRWSKLSVRLVSLVGALYDFSSSCDVKENGASWREHKPTGPYADHDTRALSCSRRRYVYFALGRLNDKMYAISSNKSRRIVGDPDCILGVRGGSAGTITLVRSQAHRAKDTRLLRYRFFVVALFLSTLTTDLADGQIAALQSIEDGHRHLNMTLCKDFCKNGCLSYRTPLGECFNPQKMFPGDISWGESDINDDTVAFTNGQVTFQRTIYSSDDATCTGTPDIETLPLNECIGPFGAPRPWGTFELV